MRSFVAAGIVSLAVLSTSKAALGLNRGSIPVLSEDTPPFRSADFEMQRESLPAVHWKIELRADGSGTYANLVSATAPGTPQPIHVGESVQSKVAAAYAVVHSGHCETKLKNIAKTGRKTLTYEAGEGIGAETCTFNYSDSDALNGLVDAMTAMAETMQAGERLAQKHRYDRLGLDAELDVLTDEVKSGRALEVANIAPVLQSVASDEHVMERAQRKAARLLQEAGVTSADSAR